MGASSATKRGHRSAPADPFASACDLVAAIRNRAVSSRELLEMYLERCDRLNPALNAIVTLDADRARSAADAADAATMRGEWTGPLHGLPMTVKDSLETAGMRTTSAADAFADYVPEQDATAVARLRAAGAIVFGKTNLPIYASDSQSFNSLFGTTNNPWDLKRTPGGSSGGAAAAVAAGLCGMELGSDIGGSLRIPAHFCGIYTIKPTYGIVPLTGHIPPVPGALAEVDVMVLGPLARSAYDLELSLEVIAGPDDGRATAWSLELPAPRANSLRKYRIAAWLDDSYSSIDREIATVYERVVSELERTGNRVDRTVGPATLAEMHDVAQRIIQGSMSMWFPDDVFLSLTERVASASPGDNSSPVRWARNVTQRMYEFGKSHEQRLQMQAKWAEFFRHYDVLLCPVTPTLAIPHDHLPDVDARTIVVNGSERPYGDQYAWLQTVGLLHLPAVVAPLGVTAGGLPVGVQIVGPYLEDRTAIDVARHMADIIGGFQAPPGY